MGIFERFLSLWVALAIAVGVGLGLAVPGLFQLVAGLEWARVNLVVAVLIWLMIYPMMLKVEPTCLKDVGRKPKGLALTLVVNWLVKPFTMAALGVFFFNVVFAGLVPAEDAQAVHRRDDSARRRALHGDGLRLEPSDRRRRQLHARAGLGERHHPRLRLRADRRPAARASPTCRSPGRRCSPRSSSSS